MKRRFRWKTAALAGFLLICFAVGFYLAELYSEISALIGQRAAALSSAIYSAPVKLEVGDDLAALRLDDRLRRLVYARVSNAARPGEYSEDAGGLTIYVRDFQLGVRSYPAARLGLSVEDGRLAAISDAGGARLERALLEPQVIGRLMPDAPAERVEVGLDDLKPYVAGGLLATEDRFFYYHPGFDPVRIIEAAVIDLRAGRLEQGASTITQQLARTFIARRGRSLRRKLRELAIALVLELRLSKRQILERYLNDVSLGDYHGAPIYGLPLGARYFFNKDLREVTAAEAALLIGMIRAPTLYDPRRHPERARARRDTVLALMRGAGLIDDAAWAASRAAPLQIAPDRGARPAPYFADYVTSLVLRIPGFHGDFSGMKVYTTLDPEAQSIAERSLRENLERLEREHPRLGRREAADRLESSMVVLDVQSGAIRAMVGGRDYAASQFNRALMAERQPGSAFKPIVYLAALDPDRSPLNPPLTLASLLPDRPMSFGGWVPANYEGSYRDRVTVADALAESLNVPTAYVGSVIGPATVVQTAHELGIREPLPAVLPISIGAGEVTLLELTSAYQVFASGGVARAPFAIESVLDGHGHLIFSYAPAERRLMRPAVAYLITAALQGVLKYGTGAGAYSMGLHFPAAGKTGTTDDFHDAYFVGYTPELVCGVWVGFDEPQSLGLPGARAALPAWVSFMRRAASTHRDFPVPDGIVMATVDRDTGALATAACPRVVSLPFLAGTRPTELCSLHGGLFSSAAPSPLPAAPASEPSPGVAAESVAPEGILDAIGRFFGSLFGR